ncbi:MAG TPA: hypothetical protein VGJ72_12575 [Polaromonas sp.]
MSIRFYSNLPAALALLVAPLWTTQASAQASTAEKPIAPTAMADAAPPAYRSALEGYQPYTDEKIVNWKEANDKAGRIGGWREYAKEARPAQTPDAAAKPNPGAVPARPQQEKP